MSVTRINKADYQKIAAYEYLVNLARVTHAAGDIWKIETPEDDLYFYTFAELMENITENLECMRELVEAGQIERELWEEAWRS